MRKDIEVSISCDECVRRSTPDCADCLVTFVLGDTPGELTLSSNEVDVVQLFTDEGLLPSLRFHRSSLESRGGL